MPKICLIALGCPKNVVEGESLAGVLRSAGWELTTDLESADCALVHTCSFISDARSESAQTIESLGRLKAQGILKKIVVTGCMVQDEGKAIVSRFPEVDCFIGTGSLHRINEFIASGTAYQATKPGGLLETASPRLLSSALPSTYLRLAEGCNHRCSFCVIPKLRGQYRSRTMASVVREAQSLAGRASRNLS